MNTFKKQMALNIYIHDDVIREMVKFCIQTASVGKLKNYGKLSSLSSSFGKVEEYKNGILQRDVHE